MAKPGQAYGDVAAGANRMLIPWFCCFRRSDLSPVRYGEFKVQIPCTTVEQAVRNLEAALPVLEAIGGDPELVRPYWALCCATLRQLPLPYLTMELEEVLIHLHAAPQANIARIPDAVSGDLSAVPHLKALSNYDDSVRPYPIDVLYAIADGERDEARTYNSSVLDGGFQPDTMSWRTSPGTQEPPPAPPLPAALFGALREVPEAIEGFVRARSPEAMSALALWPDEPGERLQVQVYDKTQAKAKELEGDARLRGQLKAVARIHLEPWCQKYGFRWAGCNFESPDWMRA